MSAIYRNCLVKWDNVYVTLKINTVKLLLMVFLFNFWGSE